MRSRHGEAKTFVAGPEAAGERLDRWLANRPGAPTRSQVGLAIAGGFVEVDGEGAKAGMRLRGGETITFRAREPAGDAGIEAEPIALDVLYADDHLAAINKAPGVVVHPAVGHRRGTLVHAILHRFPRASWPGEPERAGIVHRLDRDTSGVIVVAFSVETLEGLAKQFRDRSVEKEYLALVHGDVAAPGEIEAPIGRHPHDRKRMSVTARRARPASSSYAPLERFGVATLLSVRPRTGRTHQIRVHLAARGWPIVSDPIYGPGRARNKGGVRARPAPRLETPLGTMPRLALHAYRIAFEHPMTGERISVTAPRPPDLAAVLDALRRK